MKLFGYYSLSIYFLFTAFALNVKAKDACGIPDKFWTSVTDEVDANTVKTLRSNAEVTGPNREAFEALKDVQPGHRVQVNIQKTSKGKVEDGVIEANYDGFDGEYFYFQTIEGVRKIKANSKSIKVTGVKRFQSVPMNNRFEGVPIYEASPKHALARLEGREVTVRVKDTELDSKFGDDISDVTGVVTKSKDGRYVLKKNIKKVKMLKRLMF